MKFKTKTLKILLYSLLLLIIEFIPSIIISYTFSSSPSSFKDYIFFVLGIFSLPLVIVVGIIQILLLILFNSNIPDFVFNLIIPYIYLFMLLLLNFIFSKYSLINLNNKWKFIALLFIFIHGFIAFYFMNLFYIIGSIGI